MSGKIDIAAAETVKGTLYPPPYDAACIGRSCTRLGDAAGLTQFGVNLLHLPPGQASSQRHWHTHEDEFVYVLSGEVTLVTDAGEEALRAGDCAGFKGGNENGHCLRNQSNVEAVVLEIGSRLEGDGAFYPDIDLVAPGDGKPAIYTRRDGTPYEDLQRRAE
jgi:uncharacterized cupin superfamily protein